LTSVEEEDRFARSQAVADLIRVSTSIRNRLSGTVEKVTSDKVVSEVVIKTGAGTVTSIITTGSVKRINLKKGDSVFAIIKATEVSVEK
jgi:molybdopterin-binding protein